MVSCEKCWGDAFLISKLTSMSQTEAYQKLLKEREAFPCTPEEQAGQYWDEEKGIDIRLIEKISKIKIVTAVDVGSKDGDYSCRVTAKQDLKTGNIEIIKTEYYKEK